jgi:hypothetical protein
MTFETRTKAASALFCNRRAIARRLIDPVRFPDRLAVRSVKRSPSDGLQRKVFDPSERHA